MNLTEISDAFLSTRETLQGAGIEDEFFIDLIASRLLVERIGETKNQDWWESRILSETGRTRLDEVTPKTRLQSRVNLATKVGKKAESDRLPDDAISLFSFGPRIEARVDSAVDELSTDDSTSLTALENLTVESLEEGWTEDLITKTEANVSTSSDTISASEFGANEAVQLSEDGYTLDEINAEKWEVLINLLDAYGRCTDTLHVPHYPLESEIEANNA